MYRNQNQAIAPGCTNIDSDVCNLQGYGTVCGDGDFERLGIGARREEQLRRAHRKGVAMRHARQTSERLLSWAYSALKTAKWFTLTMRAGVRGAWEGGWRAMRRAVDVHAWMLASIAELGKPLRQTRDRMRKIWSRFGDVWQRRKTVGGVRMLKIGKGPKEKRPGGTGYVGRVWRKWWAR